MHKKRGTTQKNNTSLHFSYLTLIHKTESTLYLKYISYISNILIESYLPHIRSLGYPSA